MKQTRYGTIVKIIVLLLMVLVLPACVEKAENFDEMEQTLLDNYSTPFQERAVLQYGKDAKVVDIEAEISGGRDAVMPVTYISLSGNLLGTIQLGDEQFEALYLTEQDEIYSKRNAGKIKQSAVQLFSDMGMDVVDVIFKAKFLPDSVVDFKGLLENNFTVYAKVMVENDLEFFSDEDFFNLTRLVSDHYQGSIIFLQLNDLSEMEVIREKWKVHEISFHAPNPKAYDDKEKDYVDLFSYFDVEGYLYIDKNKSENWEFCFQNKDGVLIEKTIE